MSQADIIDAEKPPEPGDSSERPDCPICGRAKLVFRYSGDYKPDGAFRNVYFCDHPTGAWYAECCIGWVENLRSVTK